MPQGETERWSNKDPLLPEGSRENPLTAERQHETQGREQWGREETRVSQSPCAEGDFGASCPPGRTHPRSLGYWIIKHPPALFK